MLAGSLRLRITRDGATEDIVVFQDGAFSNGWGPLIDQSLGKTGKDPMYFGFRSQCKYLTAPDDKVEIELIARKDLKGIGALLSGYLPAGTYKSEAEAGWLTDESQMAIPEMFRGNAAFEAWSTQWSLTVTNNQGWTPPERAETLRNMMKQLEAETKSTEPDAFGQPSNATPKGESSDAR